MCPLRIVLVFLSATLAGYFAWKTVRSSAHSPFDDADAGVPEKATQRFDLGKAIGQGFWVFVDMASGRYLWRNLSGTPAAAAEAKER